MPIASDLSLARDAEERERWVKALEVVIHRHSGYHKSKGRVIRNYFIPVTSLLITLNEFQNIFAPSIEGRTSDVAEFERRIQEADAYLQLMIEQIKVVELKLIMNIFTTHYSYLFLIKMIEEKAARSIEAEQQDRWMRVVGTGNVSAWSGGPITCLIGLIISVEVIS